MTDVINHQYVGHIMASRTHVPNQTYQGLLDNVASKIEQLREKHQMAKQGTVTCDSLFSSTTKSLDLLHNDIYLCLATKKSALECLSYQLQHGHWRCFSMGEQTVTFYHDRSLMSQTSTVYRVEYNDRSLGIVPQPPARRGTDNGLLERWKLAKIDKMLFSRIAATFANQSTGKGVAHQLAAICNVPLEHVHRVLKDADNRARAAQDTGNREDEAAAVVQVCVKIR
jgi:hypothetical protein